jgi:hypothetical protein
VAGPNHREVPPVERCELSNVQAFGDGDDRRIGTTEAKVCILVGQLRRAPKIGERQLGQVKLAQLERPKKLDFGSGSRSFMQEVAHLGNDRGWHQERFRCAFQQAQGAAMVVVSVVGRRHQDVGVDQNRAFPRPLR